MHVLECIIDVNKDIARFFVALIKGIPSVLTAQFWRNNATLFIGVGGIVTLIAYFCGMLVLGIYVADWYFPDNRTVYQWLPIAFVWLGFLLGLYVSALYKKCKVIS